MDSKTLQTLRRDAEDICRSAIEALSLIHI